MGIDLRNISIDTSKNENAPDNEFDIVNTTFQDSTNIDNELEKCYTGKKQKSWSKTNSMKYTILKNNKLVVSTLQIAEEGHMKHHEKKYALMERRLKKEELNDEKMIKLEEKKVNA